MGVISRRRGVAAVAVVAAAALAAAGCGSSSNSSGGSNSNEKITLNVTIFQEFGYTKAGLYDQYMKDHPNITIKESGSGQGLGDENTKLDQTLAAGAGAGDTSSTFPSTGRTT